MALFLFQHQHTDETCPTKNEEMMQQLVQHTTQEGADRFGVKIHGEAVLPGEHTLVMVLEADSEATVKEYVEPLCNDRFSEREDRPLLPAGRHPGVWLPRSGAVLKAPSNLCCLGADQLRRTESAPARCAQLRKYLASRGDRCLQETNGPAYRHWRSPLVMWLTTPQRAPKRFPDPSSSAGILASAN